MKVIDPAALEEEARKRRLRQEEERRRRQKKDSEHRADGYGRAPRGVNEIPDTNSWIKRKIGTLFSDEE